MTKVYSVRNMKSDEVGRGRRLVRMPLKLYVK